jgi:hypothetical protein
LRKPTSPISTVVWVRSTPRLKLPPGVAGLAPLLLLSRVRAALVQERNAAAGTLAALKTERAQVSAQGRQVEAEAAPIVYVAEMLGVGGNSERAIRWLIALMVLYCDPLAIALTAATSARR